MNIKDTNFLFEKHLRKYKIQINTLCGIYSPEDIVENDRKEVTNDR